MEKYPQQQYIEQEEKDTKYIHSMLQICRGNVKEQNIHMHKKKVKNIHGYV